MSLVLYTMYNFINKVGNLYLTKKTQKTATKKSTVKNHVTFGLFYIELKFRLKNKDKYVAG